jgi:prepilin-type processing-associated H-X9-DG protein
MHLAWDSARTIKCASNLRQIGMGINMYVNENKGYLPEAVDQWLPVSFNGLPSLLVYYGYVDAPAFTVSAATAGGSVPQDSVFRCPEGPDNMAINAFTGNRAADMLNQSIQSWVEYWLKRGTTTYYVQNWYAINAITNNPNTPFPFDTLIVPYVYTTKKIYVVPRPSDQIAMWDSWGNFTNGNNGRVAARHRAKSSTNVLFMDAHVELLNSLTGVPNVAAYTQSGPTMAMYP